MELSEQFDVLKLVERQVEGKQQILDAIKEISDILSLALDRECKEEPLLQLATLAANAIYWRSREIMNLKAENQALKAAQTSLGYVWRFDSTAIAPTIPQPEKWIIEFCPKAFLETENEYWKLSAISEDFSSESEALKTIAQNPRSIFIMRRTRRVR
jgi:hypothetical protein